MLHQDGQSGVIDDTRSSSSTYGEVVANALQKSYRGRCGRQKAELERWMIYMRSAFIIQRAYREHIEWKDFAANFFLQHSTHEFEK